MYADEVTPGNQLNPDNNRKCWAFYISFLEFGAAVLSQEDAWICIAAIRSERVRACLGGRRASFQTAAENPF